MSVNAAYSNGVIDALEKIAAGMSMEQARDYVKNKNREGSQDALMTGAGGIAGGLGEWAVDATPMSGRMAVLPGAAMGYGLSKLKNVADSPKDMYVRDGDLTGRSIGGIAGALGGAGLGAGIGNMLDSSGWGLGLGGLAGSLLGQGVGQSAGDYATEVSNRDVIREAKLEDMKSRQAAAQSKK